jgi:hypothetical protein
MPIFRGQATASSGFTVLADDKEEAMELILDMAKEDFPDAEAYEAFNIIEVS